MKGSRSLLLSCFLAFALMHSAGAAHVPKALAARADINSLLDPSASTNTATAAATTTTSSASTASSTATTASATNAATPSNTATTTTSNTSNTNTSTAATSTSTIPTSPTETGKSTGANTGSSTTTNSAAAPATSVVTSVNAGGETVVVTETVSSATSSTSSSATSGADSSSSSSGDSGLGTGSIIGLSVAGGVAALGIVGFLIWKFTRKRFSDFDDSEAIKWPELNAHSGDGVGSHPLPVHNTGRAGFDTGSEVSLSRAPSTSTHANFSTPDLGNDPYAVPPLPHLNPNQPGPYRDDPAAVGAYYDPYRGPVPGTFSEPGTATEWGPNRGEAYPMAQMGAGGRASPGPSMMGRMSPGPGMAYEMRGPSPVQSRGSPGPQAAYDNYGR